MNPVRSGAVALALLLAAPARAEIVIDQAMITNGELRVNGRLRPTRPIPVTLDGRERVTSDAEGRFVFRAAYHPANCLVTIKAGDDTREAVVGFCGQKGRDGEPAPATAAPRRADVPI